MPNLLFDPRFRSPVVVKGIHTVRPFIKHYSIGPTMVAAEGAMHSVEITLQPATLEHAIRSICGMGQDLDLECMLRIYSIEYGPMIGDERKEANANLLFECPQLLLNERRLNTETKIDPHILVARGEVLRVRCDVQMLIWLFGTEKVD